MRKTRQQVAPKRCAIAVEFRGHSDQHMAARHRPEMTGEHQGQGDPGQSREGDEPAQPIAQPGPLPFPPGTNQLPHDIQRRRENGEHHEVRGTHRHDRVSQHRQVANRATRRDDPRRRTRPPGRAESPRRSINSSVTIRVQGHRGGQHRQHPGQGRCRSVLRQPPGQQERPHSREDEAEQPEQVVDQDIVRREQRQRQIEKGLELKRREESQRGPDRILQLGTQDRRPATDQTVLIPSHDPEGLVDRIGVPRDRQLEAGGQRHGVGRNHGHRAIERRDQRPARHAQPRRRRLVVVSGLGGCPCRHLRRRRP